MRTAFSSPARIQITDSTYFSAKVFPVHRKKVHTWRVCSKAGRLKKKYRFEEIHNSFMGAIEEFAA
jgi:hypothetical protein